MKVLILNSGMGTRMGSLESKLPKCMTKIKENETILSRQLRQIAQAGLTEVVMTTGLFDDVLVAYCEELDVPLHITFVKNEIYAKTNYIYSIYCAREYLDDDLVLMHGDLVFQREVLEMALSNPKSCMVVSSECPLPEKDFKAVLENECISKIGIEFFEGAVAAQPLYKLNRPDWNVWLDEIAAWCRSGNVRCYAENAFNEVSERCKIYPLDVKNMLCNEVDTFEDLEFVTARLTESC